MRNRFSRVDDDEEASDEAELAAAEAEAQTWQNNRDAKSRLEAAIARRDKIRADRAAIAKRKAEPQEVTARPFDIGSPFVLAGAADGKPPRFEAVVYFGGPLNSDMFDEPLVVDMVGMQMSKSLTAFIGDDQKKIAGHITSVTTDGGRLTVAGLISGTGPDVKEFIADEANGYPFQIKMKFKPEKVYEVRTGQTVEINGRQLQGPLYVARKSTLYGISFVPRGDDENSSVSVSGPAADMAG